jgi:hypothetical protein
MAGSATPLILLHFYTRGVVHRCHGWETGTLEVSVFCPLLLSFGLPSHLLIVPVMSCWRRDAAVGRLMVVAGGDAVAEISWLTMRRCCGCLRENRLRKGKVRVQRGAGLFGSFLCQEDWETNRRWEGRPASVGG